MSSKATEMVIYSDMTSKYATLVKLLYLTVFTLALSAAEDLQAATNDGESETSTAATSPNCLDCNPDQLGRHQSSEAQSSNTINYIDQVNNSFALASNSSSDPTHVRSIYLSLIDILNRMNQRTTTNYNQEIKSPPSKEQDDSNTALLTAETNNVPTISFRRLDGGTTADGMSGSGGGGGRQEKIKRNAGYSTGRPSSSGHNNQLAQAEPLNVDVYSDFSDSSYDQLRQGVVELNKKSKSSPSTSTYSDDFSPSLELLSPKVIPEKTQPLVQQQFQSSIGNNNYQNQYTTQLPPLEGSFSTKQSSQWKPSGVRFNNYELNQPPDKSLLSVTSSGDQHQSPSSPFMSSSIRDANEQRAPLTEDVPADAARFNSMFQNFERNEFPQVADQAVDYPEAEQVMKLTRSKPARPKNLRKGSRQRRPIALNNYVVQPSYNSERLRRPAPNVHHSATIMSDFSKAPLRESQLELEDYDTAGTQASKLSTNFGDTQEEHPPPPKNHQASSKHLNQGVYLQQVDTKPISSHYSFQYQPQTAFTQAPSFATTQTSHQHQPQKVYYTLVPQSAYKTSSTTNGQVGSFLTSSAGTASNQPQAQPQTVQITAIPSGLGINNQPTVVRVNGLGNLGTNVGGSLLGGTANNWLDASGRPVLMVPSDRRLDWSWLVWPMAVVVALPLVLSALFVPVFLKSMVIFIQILQSLGLVMPISSAINHQISNSSSNITHHMTN